MLRTAFIVLLDALAAASPTPSTRRTARVGTCCLFRPPWTTTNPRTSWEDVSTSLLRVLLSGLILARSRCCLGWGWPRFMHGYVWHHTTVNGERLGIESASFELLNPCATANWVYASRAMRRRHGIPDDDNRPFNVAYAAALQARKGKDGRGKVSLEDEASVPSHGGEDERLAGGGTPDLPYRLIHPLTTFATIYSALTSTSTDVRVGWLCQPLPGIEP